MREGEGRRAQKRPRPRAAHQRMFSEMYLISLDGLGVSELDLRLEQIGACGSRGGMERVAVGTFAQQKRGTESLASKAAGFT